MASDHGLERRVSRVEHDVESIYDLLTEVRAVQDGHTASLDQHARVLDQHTATLDQHTQALAEILRRLPEPS